MRASTDLTPYVPRLVLEWQRDAPHAPAREIEGTLVFVDLSGFTAMSERLSKLGKRGAEEVTDVIGATFSELLSLAYGVGGALLKFGGDALLLFFSGEEHAARACFAAHAMRAKLRDLSPILTPAGQVRLRMSVGAHSGRFAMFLAGDSHREFVITGPAATETVHMEHAASAGEILVSPATAAVLGARHVGAEKQGGRLLARRPVVAAAGAPPALPEGTLSPQEFVPRAIRAHIEGGGAGAEHRLATVAFIRFTGVEASLQRTGLDGTARALDALVGGVQRRVDEHGLCFLGTDVDEDGGKIILLAGAPQAYDDDEERMLRVVAEVPGLQRELSVQVGVNRGPVFVGDVGPAYRRTFTVMGDAVNTAARVMARAEAGWVLVTPAVLDRVPGRFDTDEIPPFAAKGKSAPLRAHRLGAARSGGASARAGEREVPLVGRDRELATLVEALASARAGAATAVDVRGEPGIGKSRLVEELTRRAGDADVLAVRSDRYEQRTPYATLRRIVRPLLGIEADPCADDAALLRAAIERHVPDLVESMPMLAAAAGIDVRAGDDLEQGSQALWARRLNDAVLAVLERRAPSRTLFVFEDAQWMDEASFAVLRALVQRRPDRAWLFGVVRRADDERALPGATTVALEPLRDGDAVKLARHLSLRPLLPHDATALVRRSGGNPSFLRELVEAYDPRAGVEGLPETLESIIAARIDGLSPNERARLRRLSVLGMEFGLDAAAAIEDDADVARALAPLAPFLEVTQGRARFRAALFRDAAYASLPFRLRRALHQRAGEALEATLDPGAGADVLAIHFHEARDFERSWRYARAAADQAGAKFAFPDAVHLYQRALEAARALGAVSPEETAPVWRALGDALRNTGRLVDAQAAYRTARKHATGNDALTARLFFLEGLIRTRLGKHAEAMRWNTRGLRLLEGRELSAEEGRDRVRLIAACGAIRFEQGRYDEAMRWYEDALREAEAIGDVPGMAYACNLMMIAGTKRRDPDADAFGRRAYDLFGEAGSRWMQGQVLNGLAVHARTFGRWTEAVGIYARSRATLDSVGDAVGAAVVENNVGELLADQGRLPEARAAFEEALTAFTAARHAYASPVLGNLARVAMREGRFEEAAALFARAREGLEKMGAASFVRETDVRLAELALVEGRAADAREAAAVLLKAGDATLEPTLLRIRASAAFALGELKGARELFEAALESARALHHDFEAALALLGLARAERALGRDPTPSEADAILRRLDVIAIAAFPPAGAGGAV